MRDFTAKAHAQNRNVVVEVFHSADGHPLLIHTAAVRPTATAPPGNRVLDGAAGE
jgi:hypothetical protein